MNSATACAHACPRNVEHQDVYAGIAQEAKTRPVGVLLDQLQHLLPGELSGDRHALGLQFGIFRADVRIEPRAGARHRVTGNRGGGVDGGVGRRIESRDQLHVVKAVGIGKSLSGIDDV